MGKNSEFYKFQSPSQGDAQAVTDLMSHCEIAEYGESDSEIDDLLHDWSQIDLENDAWLVYDNLGDLIGYGAVIPWFSSMRFDIFIHPSITGIELGQTLLNCIEKRGREISRTGIGTTILTAKVYIAHVNIRNNILLTSNHYHLAKYHFQMQIHFDRSPTPLTWPEETVVRPARPGEDDFAIYMLINDAFTHPGRISPTFDEWKSSMMRPDLFDPALWLLALSGQELVGACLGFQYPSVGWVRQLGVMEGWRRKGLGSALLSNAFVLFYNRGLHDVGLSVAADNLNAQIFYKNLGMTQVRQYDEYEKHLEG